MSAAWEMGKPSQPELHPWLAGATATATITNGMSGAVNLNVTTDVAAYVAWTSWVGWAERALYASHMRMSVGLLLLALAGCDGAPRSPKSAPSAVASTALPETRPTMDASSACGDVVGAWSSVVSGMRGRLVTSGAKPDRSALRIVLELENVSGQGALEINWEGYVHLGFVTFRLDDATGNDVEPPWRLGGNSPSGKIRATFQPGKVVQYEVHGGPFGSMQGARILRIGAFWGRELASDGSKRFLRGRVTGGPALADAIAYEGAELVRTAPRGQAWIGSLELPAVCVE